MTDETLTIRLYDKIEEMRGDVASMASDVRNLATKIEPVVTQVGDHEARIRHVEQTGATKADVEAVEAAVDSLQRWRWKSVGITSGISVALASGATAGILQAFAGKH